MIINSRQNNFVQYIVDIKKNSGKNKSVCLVEGVRACSSFANSTLYKHLHWIVTENAEKYMHFRRKSHDVVFVSEKIMEYVSGTVSPQGIIGVFTINYDQSEIESCMDSGTFVLDRIMNPGNIGTIIRTAFAFGRKCVISIDGCNFHNVKVVQASAGTISQIKVFRVSFEDFFILAKKFKLKIGALSSKGKNIKDFDKSEDRFLLIGNEAHGISKDFKSIITESIAIPMNEKCESLNASVAASIAGYNFWG
jgi:TrmH family RNA methyltransferase